jgi:hypothetical protein
LLDGDTTLVAVQPMHTLPCGAELGGRRRLLVQLIQELAQQPLYQELLHLDATQGALWGIERARKVHVNRLTPIALGVRSVRPLLWARTTAAAAGLAQCRLTPSGDRQVSASRGLTGQPASCYAAGWGVLLRRGLVLDRLAELAELW